MRSWFRLDMLLVASALATIWGVIIIYSIGFKATSVQFGAVRNQAIFALFGLVIMLVLSRVDYRLLAKFTPWLYIGMMSLLLLVLLVGHQALGATRWIDLGIIKFQPSEPAKLVLIIILAKFFSSNYDRINSLMVVGRSALYTAAAAGLVILQPDLGTAIVLVFIWLFMILAAKIKTKYLLMMFVGFLLFIPVGIQFLKPYQKARIATFLNPAGDPLNRGYNVRQAVIAAGSGKLFGRGLGAGSQSQLNFLPAQHTDFIFAALAEKQGFVGAVLLLALYAFLLFRLRSIGSQSKDRFGYFLVSGVAAMMLIHVVINIGMNLGVLPVTGIPLPFISYGGTSIVTMLSAMGLAASVARAGKGVDKTFYIRQNM